MTVTNGAAWSAEDDALLARLWREGKSGTEISVAMPGMRSRNAVIGRIHRLAMTDETLRRLPRVSRRNQMRARVPKPPRPPKTQILGRARNRGFRERLNSLVTTREILERTAPEAPPIPPAARADKPKLTDLNHRECRWPLGDPRHPDFHFCGAPLDQHEEEQPYCPYHYHAAHNVEAAG